MQKLKLNSVLIVRSPGFRQSVILIKINLAYTLDGNLRVLKYSFPLGRTNISGNSNIHIKSLKLLEKDWSFWVTSNQVQLHRLCLQASH